MKILYMIPSLYASGGMERVLTNKANYLVEKGFDVFIITTDQKNKSCFYHLNNKVKHIDLNINYIDNQNRNIIIKPVYFLMNVFKHRTRLKKLLKQLQVNISISMFRNDMAILPYIKDGSKKILEFHFSYPLFKLSHRKGLLGIYDKLQNNFIKHIKKYDKFIVLTKEDIDYWDDLLNIDSIPNARTFVCDSPAELNNKIACTVGSLIYRKGYDRLIEAWSKISLIVPDWKLYIYGSGSLQNELQNKINEAGLTDNILLKGVITDIKTCYLQSSLFILTSRLEGLPMCILEAQSAGLPIVSYNCPCGPRDVIENGKDGFIIENNDINDLAEKILLLIKNEKLRMDMGKYAFENSKRFSEDIIMNRWIALFTNLENNKIIKHA